VSVVTDPILAGQSVIVGTHEVIVYIVVLYTVDVVYCVTEVDFSDVLDGEPVSEAVTGHMVV